MNAKGIKRFLNELRNCDPSQQQLFLNQLSASIYSLTSKELQVLLDFLTVINDFDLEVKLFSLLCVCIASSEHFYQIIILYNPIYEKLEKNLSRGICLKTTVIFNFITMLLCKDPEVEILSSKTQLPTHARNMIRVSGCLRWMTSYFSNSMVFVDTWKALCQCLAECCRDSPMNKEQCSHLVPLCIKKGLQRKDDVLIVLQSLLSNHSKNVKIFLKSNGIKLFKKENLQLTTCLQLLSSLAQNSDVACALRDSDVPSNVAEILHWSGPHSQKGQWCTVILYYLNPDKNSLVQSLRSKTMTEHETQENQSTPSEETARDLTLKPRTNNNVSNKKIKQNNDDTANLLRNVMQEVLYWKNNENYNLLKSGPSSPVNVSNKSMVKKSVLNTNNTAKKARNAIPTMNLSQDSNDALSFTFLEEESLLTKPEHQQDFFAQNIKTKDILGSTTNHFLAASEVGFDYNEFRPTITSSPKHKYWADETLNCEFSSLKTGVNIKLAKKTRSTHTTAILQRKQLRRTRKDVPIKKLSNRSMSTKIFEAVNETCTTIVKTVKDIFAPWKKDNINKSNATQKHKTQNFMEYMQKRDAMLEFSFNKNTKGNAINKFNFTSYIKDTCLTCNDTKMLKQKSNIDEQLKTSIKKLKLGINLYGCDFKKISNTLWPNETYMTPTVLYNLYRKLILK